MTDVDKTWNAAGNRIEPRGEIYHKHDRNTSYNFQTLKVKLRG